MIVNMTCNFALFAINPQLMKSLESNVALSTVPSKPIKIKKLSYMNSVLFGLQRFS
jgi:hypothetical protein